MTRAGGKGAPQHRMRHKPLAEGGADLEIRLPDGRKFGALSQPHSAIQGGARMEGS